MNRAGLQTFVMLAGIAAVLALAAPFVVVARTIETIDKWVDALEPWRAE